MQIFNAKKNGINVFLDNSEVLTINPGEVSKPFMGSVSVVTQILSLGQPDEIAIIVTSSYELDILRVKNASLAYMFNSVDAARAKLLEGKDLTPSPTTVTMAEHEKVKKVLADITAQRDELQRVVEELNKKLEVAPSTKLLHEIDDKNKEIVELTSKVSELTTELESVSADLNTVTSERDNSRAESDQLQAKVQELDDLVKELRSQLEVAGAGATQMLDPKDSDEYKKLQAELDSANASLNTFKEVAEARESTLKEKIAELESTKSLLKTADDKVVAQGDKLRELEEQLAEANKRYTELSKQKADVEDGRQNAVNDVITLRNENEALKADGAKLVEQYKDTASKLESVKGMLKTCMDQFGITYEDGAFKMMS